MFVNETSLKKLMNGEELTEMERTTIERSFEALRSNREAKQRAREQLERDVLDCLKKKKCGELLFQRLGFICKTSTPLGIILLPKLKSGT